MKKVLKIIAIVVAVIVVAVAVLLIALSKAPSPGAHYWEKIETGGEIEAKYLAAGPFETAYYEEATFQWFSKYEIWYPAELATSDRTYPVIVVCNGTGQTGAKQRNIYEHYASWGFIVIATDETYSWNAFGAEMCIRHLELLNGAATYGDKDNIFFGKIDFANVGVVGHSQGGVGVINAITNTDHRDMYKTAVALSPTGQALAASIEWPYDATLIDVPILIISGEGGGDDWVITGEGLSALFADVPGDALAVRRVGTPHGNTSYSEDGYVIAWFMWQLQGDAEAAKAFTGDAPEIMTNPLYCDQQSSLR